MKREEVKHGQKVLVNGEEWEVLDRATFPAHWYIHRWTDAGEWLYRVEHPLHMQMIDQGAREPQLIGG